MAVERGPREKWCLREQQWTTVARLEHETEGEERETGWDATEGKLRRRRRLRIRREDVTATAWHQLCKPRIRLRGVKGDAPNGKLVIQPPTALKLNKKQIHFTMKVCICSLIFSRWMPVWQPWQYWNTNGGTFGLRWQIYGLQQPAVWGHRLTLLHALNITHTEKILVRTVYQAVHAGAVCVFVLGDVCALPIWLCGNLHWVWLRWRAG